MHERLIEMSVGETILIGRYWVTLLDVDGDQLCIQIEREDDGECEFETEGDLNYLQVV